MWMFTVFSKYFCHRSCAFIIWVYIYIYIYIYMCVCVCVCYSLSFSLLIWLSVCCVSLSVFLLLSEVFVIFQPWLLMFECLYYFLSACLLVLKLSGCLLYAINICIISQHDYIVIIRNNYLNVYVIIGVWGILWIFMLFSACFPMVSYVILPVTLLC